MSNLQKSNEVPPKINVLWHSVAPWVASGYGKPTREICTRLPKYGFKTYISAYYGADPGGSPPYPVPVLPSKEGTFGTGSAAQYCKKLGIDVAILYSDWWAFNDFPNLPNATLYSPMDHVNYSEEIWELTRKYRKVISMCMWQQKCLKEVDIDSDCVYLGVDLNVFKPSAKKEAKKEIRYT